MDLNFPLMLFVLVFCSGLIWLFDLAFAAPRRKLAAAQLRLDYFGRRTGGNISSSRLGEYRVRHKAVVAEPMLVEYAKSFFPVLLFVFVLRSFLVEPFQIPSGSMVPTLQVGDYILVNKYAYGIRLPVVRRKMVANNAPQRGDVMVFFPPHLNDIYYIKRVIGLPGDHIRYSDKQLYINDRPVARRRVELPHTALHRSTYVERLGAFEYQTMQSRATPARNFSVTVKPGHYFMMGDNRDNSSDSRYWGQVPDRDIVGKAFAIWMHWESFFSIPGFDRVGAINHEY